MEEEHRVPLLSSQHTPYSNTTSTTSTTLITSLPSLIAIFCIKVDVKRGNILEYFKSNSTIHWTGIEFKALPSGIHKVEEDYCFFMHEQWHGISCIQNLKTTNHHERTMKCRSVGILLQNGIHHLSHYIESLHQLVLECNRNESQLSTLLESYFEQFIPIYSPRNVVSHEQVWQIGGVNTMLLWKALRAKKRVLFFTEQSIGKLCSEMEQWIPTLCSNSSSVIPKQYYYINLNDMNEDTSKFENEYFVACCTEAVFKQLYHKISDVFVVCKQNHHFEIHASEYLKLTTTDVFLYNALKEETITFSDLNTQMHQMIQLLSSTSSISMQELHDSYPNLIDKKDEKFIQQLIAAYDLETILLPNTFKCCC